MLTLKALLAGACDVACVESTEVRVLGSGLGPLE